MGSDPTAGDTDGPDAARVELRLSAVADNVVVARQAISGFADAFAWDAHFVEDVRLAVSEACTNVVEHAYRSAASPGEMLLSIVIDAGRLVVAVRDSGGGFDARPSPGGVGLSLMAAVSDAMDVRSAPGSTEVRLTFAPHDGGDRGG